MTGNGRAFYMQQEDTVGEERGGQGREKTMAEEMITAKDEEQIDEAKADKQKDTEKTEKDTPSFDDILKDPKMQAEFDRRLSKAQQTREENIRSEIESDIKARLAEEQKVAKMNAEEKANHERIKLEKERDDLKNALNRERLGKIAASTLSKSGIEADETVLQFVVGADEDATGKNIEAFLSVVEKQVEAIERKRNSGKTPRDYSSTIEPEDEFDRILKKYK